MYGMGLAVGVGVGVGMGVYGMGVWDGSRGGYRDG